MQIDPETRIQKTREFPIKDSNVVKYPENGLNVGPAIYRTNNMNYGNIFL